MTSQLPPGTDLCQIPAGVPPPGVVPDLTSSAPLAPATIAVSTVLTTLSVVFTVGRIWTNIHKLKAADFFAIIALALNGAYTGLVLAMTKYARHQWDTPACWFNPTYMKVLFAQGVVLGPVIFFAKAAILLLYLQIFTSHRPMRIAVYVGIVFTGLTYWASVPLEIAFAAPHPGETWGDLLLNGRPEKLIYWGIVQGTLAVVIDLYIFILPLPVLWRLHMSLKRRVALCAIFFTALMGVIASVIALTFRVGLLNTHDTTWVQSQLFICVITENNIALIVSSVPAFKTIWKQHITESNFFKTLTSRVYGSGSGSGGTRASKGYGLNKYASKEQNSKDNSSERSLKHFVSHGQGGGSYEFNSYSSPVVQIQGGSKDGKPGFVTPGARGIVRNFDITQEVSPENRV
ncbi:hypothetical protein TARUN_332 [Trichoderma arundinaceum]|uniref:Rhodopsin domain-containing protein n=1 Tax=Trichoderma arundinaceum TaxID=490622 RepID=A0A395P0N2_TRIAR|nr:hypothetical protein TARUN_332 [Trichoderma arundinaceum]